MKIILRYLVLSLLIGAFHLNAQAQQVNTLYFMENVPVRNNLNPAFQPITNFYLGLPILGLTQFGIGNNSLSLKDVIYNNNGQTISFLDQNGDINRFYNTLKSTTVARADLQTNLLSFGFRYKSTYWNLSISEKIDGMVSIPKDFFLISLYGTPTINNNSFNLASLQSDFTAYTETAIGCSKILNENLTVGVRLKLLFGNANLSNTNNGLHIKAGIAKWSMIGSGSANVSSPLQFQIADNYRSYSILNSPKISDWLRPSGLGAGMDAGFSYRLNDNINLSGAITDLGFISWFKNVQNVNYRMNYTFDGISKINSNTSSADIQNLYNQLIFGNSLVDTITSALYAASNLTKTSKVYTTAITAKLNLGFEYNILENKVGFGLLFHSQFLNNTITEELTGSVNLRPNKWLNTSVSYSVFNSRMSAIGVGVGLKTGLFHWLLSADYIPFYKSTLSLADFGSNYPNIKIPIPYNTQSFNLAFGMNFVFNSFLPKQKEKHALLEDQFYGSKLAAKNKEQNFGKSKLNSSKSSHHRFFNAIRGLFVRKSKRDCNCDAY